ncbi:MAG: hypothetical protein ABSG51_07225 [Terracidiphilus sp.]|jgi:hypothetical protein
MESNLRPFTLGEILDRTAELYRRNFVLFAGIFAPYAGTALVLNLLLLGLQMLSKNAKSAEPELWLPLAGGLVEMLILGILFGPVVAAVSRAVAWVNMDQPASIRSAYSSTLSRAGRYLWLMTITAVVVWLPIALLYMGFFGVMISNIKGFGTPAQQVSMADPKALMTVGIAAIAFFILIFPVGIYTILMGLRYAMALPACVVEDTPALASLRRAIDLSKGARWRIFVLGLLVGVIKIGLVGITQIFTFVGIFKSHGQISPTLSIISQLIGFFTNTFLGPIYATGITLLYYDQRVRNEGFDIEWMMHAAGLTVPAPAPPSLPVPEPPAVPTESVPHEDQPENPLVPGNLHE